MDCWRSSSATCIGSVLVGLLSHDGPGHGHGPDPRCHASPYGKSIVLPGLLNWLSCIGWDGINSVFGAAALSILIPALPFVARLVILVAFQAGLSIVGHEAIHLFEKWMAIVLAIMFAVLTVAIAGKASVGLARTDGFTDLDQVGAFVLYASITASFVIAWALYASDYSRYLPVNASRSRVFWLTVLGLTLSAGWIETLGLLVADKATGGAVDTINSILSGSILAPLAMVAIAIGTIAVNAMNDYTGSLSLQGAGLRIPRVYSADRGRRAGLPVHPLPELRRLWSGSSRTTCCSSSTGSLRGPASCWPTGGCAAGRRMSPGWRTSPPSRQGPWGSRRWRSGSSSPCRSARPSSARRSPTRRGCRSTGSPQRSITRTSRTWSGSSWRRPCTGSLARGSVSRT